MLWAGLGLLSLAVGLVGIVVPLLPTTPLLLLSAFCFARGSPRLNRWLNEHPRLGPPLEQWRRHGAISARGKRNAILAMAAMPPLTLAMGASLQIVGLQCLVLALPAVFILTRPSPPDSDGAERSDAG